MSKTMPLRTVIKTLLDPFCPDVAYGDASDGNKYPRVAFELRELGNDYKRVLIDLEVNVIDRGFSEAWVENTADAVQSALDKHYHIDGDIQFTCYAGKRIPVREDDKTIKRRQLSFEIHLHGRSEWKWAFLDSQNKRRKNYCWTPACFSKTLRRLLTLSNRQKRMAS